MWSGYVSNRICLALEGNKTAKGGSRGVKETQWIFTPTIREINTEGYKMRGRRMSRKSSYKFAKRGARLNTKNLNGANYIMRGGERLT